SSASTGSLVTITPSLFAREQAAAQTASTTPSPGDQDDPFVSSLPPPPAKGPKLFLTSAKTGTGVSDVFEYIARRVVRRTEYLERLESRRLHIRESSAAETIRLGLQNAQRSKEGRSCCAS
ncbi:hypothetical protein BDN72DRAFT_747440, partial [Pluteus cervinus]